MKLIAWNELEPKGPYAETPTALTIGVFDGVHLGHRAVIARVVHNDAGLLPAAVTFGNNPQNVLRAEHRVKDILTVTQKLSIIESLGVAVAVMIDFSLDFSKMSATSFLSRLSSVFRIQKIVEGDNFHFGSGREADRRALAIFCAGLGAELETPERVAYRGAPVSSTRVRRAIRAGQIGDVTAMLAGEYTVIIPVPALSGARDGVLTVDKAALSQEVPDRGAFRCSVASAAGRGEAAVEIDGRKMYIRTPLRAAAITFQGTMP
jgi:riboflavin kinase/FMN adenylyltransferase